MSSKDIWNEYIKIIIIDSGKYSFVYKAKNKKNGNYVAIKEINKEKYFESTKSYFNEEEIIKKLNSVTSISLREIIETDNFFIL